MKIKILGSGCNACQKLYRLVEDIVEEDGGKDSVEYITGESGTKAILELGVMGSPVLVVDGRVVMVGFIPNESKVRQRIYGLI